MVKRKPAAPVIALRQLLAPGRIGDLRIGSAGHHPAKTQWIDARFTAYAIGLVIAGRGTYRVDDGPVRAIAPGSAFAVYPGPVFHYGPDPGPEWEERYLAIDGPGVKRWLDAGWLWNDGTVRQLSDWTHLVDLHRQIVHVLQRGESGDTDRAVVFVERYLMEMYYARSSLRLQQRSAADLDAVLEHCRSHYAQPIDFHKLAGRHALSYSSLRQRLRRMTGLSPARYLTNLRCGAARALLTDTELSVKEIAGRVGIADPYTFSRTFKRCIGLSPENYRRQHAPWRSPS